MALIPIPFSDTTKKTGLIQLCEFWCGLNDAQISGDATLLKVFTARINAGFDRIMPYLYSYSTYLKWDDTNQTDEPVGTFNIVSGQSDYTIATDDNSLDILNITGVRIYYSATGTYYYDLKEMSADDRYAEEAISPNTQWTGTPTHYLKRGNTIFLFPQPNYSATSGCKIYFEREASYFLSTDTTKEAGIPRPCQELLALYASYDYLLINSLTDAILITRIEQQIAKREMMLRDFIETRFPSRTIMSARGINFR